MTLADSLHSRANGTSASLAIVFPHKKTSQSIGSINRAVLYLLLASFRPFAGKSLAEVDVLMIKFKFNE